MSPISPISPIGPIMKTTTAAAAATGTSTGLVELTHDQPRRTEWDTVRETVDQITFHGRQFLRGQVRLGMLLAGLKKAHGIQRGGDRKSNGGIRPLIGWEQIVVEETGFGRRRADEFLGYYEAAKAKLKRSKTLDLPDELSDAIILFQSENALALTEEQWIQVDDLIGTLTSGETQASLMQELGIVPKPAKMPVKTGTKDQPAEPTAGQLAFHFFDGVAAPLINARTNPDYKLYLLALPLHSDAEHPLSLATLKAEARALIADIEEAEQANAKPAKGKVITV